MKVDKSIREVACACSEKVFPRLLDCHIVLCLLPLHSMQFGACQVAVCSRVLIHPQLGTRQIAANFAPIHHDTCVCYRNFLHPLRLLLK